ncbi:hypothetical protein C3747_258g41 [Trypanosoma cruzi]|uniref:C3H1-type domain-containing protein n=2 Tax=Trypanosoma cruzi TaxID=5693 RepID=Q4CTV0_TRYCC|nr:hypothetical protein, conserved [Trypanosoma cruzi]EAN83698.1 hypothetical protein, conserved [Trypanosoma cruzi]PWU96404.1 hypothetical protein C3747_258g41 [Trypanosoma cruzi]|eukprot:XP_805549.1 hypothetical protein [Trypanosoma cruzi strain CL Brener]
MMPKDPGLWGTGLLGGTSTGTSGGGANANSRGATGMGGGNASAPITSTVAAANAAATTSLPSGNSYAFLSSSAVTATSPSVLVQSGGGGVNGMGSNAVGLMPAIVSHDRSQELCKYFLNGGCLRGAQCQYLHELPDERHLDVNGYGYILNPNVHNAQKTLPLAMNSNPTGTVQVNGGALSPSPLMLGLSSSGSRQTHGAKAKPQTSFMVGVPTHLPFQLSSSNAKASPPKYRPPEPFLDYNLPPTLALPFNTPPKDVALQLTRTMLQN